MNSQILSKKRLGLATVLMVLSASALLAQDGLAQDAKTGWSDHRVNNIRFKGAFDGRDTGVVQGGTLLAEGSGAGTASHIGPFTYTAKATVDPTGLSSGTGLSRGIVQLVAANGDVINGSFVGRGGPTDTPNVGHIVELMTITGGSGRFQGATGSFTFDRLEDETSLPVFALTYGTLTGTISIVK